MRKTPLEPWMKQKTGGLDVQSWQLAKLNETLALVRSHSPFYSNLFTGFPVQITNLDELSQFPFTTAEDVRANPLRFVCVSQGDIQRVVTMQSSGTSGEPKRLFFTAEDQELTIDFFGVGMSVLTRLGDKVLILLPGETPNSIGDLLRIGLSKKGMQPVPYGPVRDPLHALDVIHSEKIDCLVGSPTQVLGLARRWQPGQHKPRTVLLSTDYVSKAIVTILEQTWGCEVYNHYGTTEMGLGGGVECEAHSGYHLREADLYFEIVNPENGEQVPDGEYGEVVFTTLTRRGMPLIRYRMGDRSRFLLGNCQCGTTLKRMETVCGRYGGFVSSGDALLHMPDLDEALFPIPGLLNFSATVTDDAKKSSLLVDVQMLSDMDATTQVMQALQSIANIQKFDVIVHCHYSPNETGSLKKRQIVDQRESVHL